MTSQFPRSTTYYAGCAPATESNQTEQSATRYRQQEARWLGDRLHLDAEVVHAVEETLCGPADLRADHRRVGARAEPPAVDDEGVARVVQVADGHAHL